MKKISPSVIDALHDLVETGELTRSLPRCWFDGETFHHYKAVASLIKNEWAAATTRHSNGSPETVVPTDKGRVADAEFWELEEQAAPFVFNGVPYAVMSISYDPGDMDQE